jgi:hypothetical protein
MKMFVTDKQRLPEDVLQSPECRYRHSPIHGVGKAFCFPNDETRNALCIKIAFSIHGHSVADVQREMFGMMTWVLTSTGQLWLHDKSHGGGGYFVLEAK